MYYDVKKYLNVVACSRRDKRRGVIGIEIQRVGVAKITL
jgi:hypothetical protein